MASRVQGMFLLTRLDLFHLHIVHIRLIGNAALLVVTVLQD